MTPDVDLIVVFRASAVGKVLSKAQARQNAHDAEAQYTKLLEVLRSGGLRAIGKRGEREGQLLILVSCPPPLIKRLAQRERHSDFLCGLPANNPIRAEDLDSTPMCPADHLRLVHTYLTATRNDGGLGVAPLSEEWDRVESIMALHDHLFNDTWIRAWTRRQLGFVQLDKIKEQFGESVALYFSFLSSYTKSLVYISAIGVLVYLFANPYSTLYSTLLVLWSITFVEWWRIQQRILSVRWGTKGSFRVEKRRAQFQPIAWWRRDLRMIASLPVISLFAAVLAVLLTGIFVFEAFVTQLYTGPGHRLVVCFLRDLLLVLLFSLMSIQGFSPTILFMALVPRFLGIYQKYAVRLTNWENHAHQSTHDASLTIKTFSLSAIVAYLGLALSSFIYVPFGEEVMSFVQVTLFNRNSTTSAKTWATSVLSAAGPTASAVAEKLKDHHGHHHSGGKTFWETDHVNARNKLNPSRLRDQMFAFTVTNQVVNTFLEIGLPFVLRAVESVRSGKGLSFSSGTLTPGSAKKKRVAFEEDTNGSDVAKNANGKEEREFMERVRREVALPEYSLFVDYSEMVTQFGYVALWSTIWPLATLTSLVNNWLELRSDAFKIAVHTRRPIPSRSDTIGPWLDSLTFLTWLSALTNSALIYLFRPTDSCKADFGGTSLQRKHHTHTQTHVNHHGHGGGNSTRELLFSAMLVALAASHGYMIVRVFVRHVLERVFWKGSREEMEEERLETVVKEEYLKSLGVGDVVGATTSPSAVSGREEDKDSGMDMKGQGMEKGEEVGDGLSAFWEYDEAIDELQKGVKDA